MGRCLAQVLDSAEVPDGNKKRTVDLPVPDAEWTEVLAREAKELLQGLGAVR